MNTGLNHILGAGVIGSLLGLGFAFVLGLLCSALGLMSYSDGRWFLAHLLAGSLGSMGTALFQRLRPGKAVQLMLWPAITYVSVVVGVALYLCPLDPGLIPHYFSGDRLKWLIIYSTLVFPIGLLATGLANPSVIRAEQTRHGFEIAAKRPRNDRAGDDHPRRPWL